MWDKHLGPLDWLVIIITLGVAGLTLYAASYPILGTDAFYLGVLAWPLVAILWSATLLASAHDRIGTAAALLLLLGSVVSIGLVGVTLLVIFLAGPVGFAVAVAIGLTLLSIVVARGRPRRVAWLLAPGIVLLMLGLMYSGLPRLTRMTLAEPSLTEFARSIERGDGPQMPTWFDSPIAIGTIPVYEAYMEQGQLHLVTGYVGILADDPAGLAYLPAGVPEADPPYEHLVGPWYRWYPY